ncbi:MAG: hypothetical protein OEV06_07810 [Anaerolineae bacterium]|nr:hypothetical protein [Anaerolineae bacterium]
MPTQKAFQIIQNGLILLILSACASIDSPKETAVPFSATLVDLSSLDGERDPESTDDPAQNLVEVQRHQCIADFDTFAYYPVDYDSIIDLRTPTYPWQLEVELPERSTMEYGGDRSHVEKAGFARWVKGEVQIWVKRDYSYGNKRVRDFVIYFTESGEWKSISRYVWGTAVFVEDLFEAVDGSLWGVNLGSIRVERLPNRQVPILSKFNESTETFELSYDGPVYPETSQFIKLSSTDPEVVMDDEGVFWIYVKNVGLYSFDPVREQTIKHIDAPNLSIWDSALSPDRSIYYRGRVWEEHSIPPGLEGVGMIRLDLDTGKLYPVDSPETWEPNQDPEDRWPDFDGMVVDAEGRLWLGATGRRETDGSWTLIHPNMDGYLASFDEYPAYVRNPFLNRPRLYFQSSNGYLWFFRSGDGPGNSGSAWYDPETGTGCWFLGWTSFIIDDAVGRIWLVEDEKLYKLDLTR